MPDTDVISAGQKPASTGERRFSLRAGSRLWLEGDSTLHRFSVEATELHGEVVVSSGEAGSDLNALLRAGTLRSGELVVPVRKLTSHESGLVDNLRAALKADRSPTILYRVDSYEVLPPEPGGPAWGLKLSGRLSIAGTERPSNIEARADSAGAGLRLTGSKELVMTDFGVRPPTLMMGMVRVKERIVVRFAVELQPA